MSTPKSVIEMARKERAKMVDAKFVDTFGTWQHFSCPIAETLDYSEKVHAFRFKGDVFAQDFLEMWASHDRKEHDALRLRPHPYEFFLDYDV